MELEKVRTESLLIYRKLLIKFLNINLIVNLIKSLYKNIIYDGKYLIIKYGHILSKPGIEKDK